MTENTMTSAEALAILGDACRDARYEWMRVNPGQVRSRENETTKALIYLAALQSNLEAHQQALESECLFSERLQKDFDSLQAKCDAMKADARRYRWLRKFANPDDESGVSVAVFEGFNSWGRLMTTYPKGCLLDDVVDAAMAIPAEPMTHEQEAHEANVRA